MPTDVSGALCSMRLATDGLRNSDVTHSSEALQPSPGTREPVVAAIKRKIADLESRLAGIALSLRAAGCKDVLTAGEVIELREQIKSQRAAVVALEPARLNERAGQSFQDIGAGNIVLRGNTVWNAIAG